MNLANAASYFADTPISGWNGTAWVDNLTTVTLLPYDRFISDREFGNKRREILVRPDDNSLDGYSLIKFTQSDEVYLLGTEDSDINVEKYSRIFLIHRAAFYAGLYEFVKTPAASGMAGSVTRTKIADYWCDIERVTFSRSKEFAHIVFPQMYIRLPIDCDVTSAHELSCDGNNYAIQEVVIASGMKECRALVKAP